MAFIAGTTPEQQFYQCDKVLGPSFSRELEDAGGLIGQHFSWFSPGLEGAAATIEFFEDTPQEVIDAVISVYQSHDPGADLIDSMAVTARLERDRLLRSVYDPGILMAMRSARMASSPEETAYAEGKIAELDAYAELLQGVPQQSGFPQDINWPSPPVI